MQVALALHATFFQVWPVVLSTELYQASQQYNTTALQASQQYNSTTGFTRGETGCLLANVTHLATVHCSLCSVVMSSVQCCALYTIVNCSVL